jgi:hypothetical protein
MTLLQTQRLRLQSRKHKPKPTSSGNTDISYGKPGGSGRGPCDGQSTGEETCSLPYQAWLPLLLLLLPLLQLLPPPLLPLPLLLLLPRQSLPPLALLPLAPLPLPLPLQTPWFQLQLSRRKRNAMWHPNASACSPANC